MRPKLLRSFILVTIFWFTLSTLYWGLADPKESLRSLAALKDFAPWLPLSVPESASVLNAWYLQLLVLAWWTLPLWALTGATAFVGAGLVWLGTFRRHRERIERETGHGNFRGVTLTMGTLPMPGGLPREDLDLGADDSGALDRLTEKEKLLLGQILGTIAAAEGACAGPGIECTLLENALNMASRALDSARHPGLSAIVAAAHEMGKITAYAKNERGEWALVKSQDREAGRILATLPGWWELPAEDRSAVLLAVKYRSNPRLLPGLESEQRGYRFARELLEQATEAQESVLAEEKQKTLEKRELPDLIFEAFVQSLPLLAYQSRGLPQGVRAVAWKHGSRVYLLEIELRERTLAKLDPTVRGALTASPRERSRVQPFTRELLKALDARGWLVRELGSLKLEPGEALWVIKAGKLEFRGIIIIEVPTEHLESLPAQDSIYPVSVLSPLFQHPGITPVAKSDLGGILQAKPATPAPGAQGASAAPAPRPPPPAEAPGESG